MKRILALSLLILCTLQAGSVLKEKNLARTLGVLRAELETNYQKQKIGMARYERLSTEQHKKLVDYMQRSEQISLMIYSQKADFTFDVAYACQQATNLHHELKRNNVPYDRIRRRLKNEVERYDALVRSLEELPPAIGTAKGEETLADSALQSLSDSLAQTQGTNPFTLNEAEQKDREICLVYAKALRNNFVRMLNTITSDSRYYDSVNHKVDELKKYAEERYADLQQTIFINGGDNYIKTIMSLPYLFQQTKHDVSDKYKPLERRSSNYSEWRGPIVIFISLFVIFYILVGIAMSCLLLYGLPKLSRRLPERFAEWRKKVKAAVRWKWILGRRPTIAMMLSMISFSISVMFVKEGIEGNFLRMATDLLTNFSWLVVAILFSLLIRSKQGERQIKETLRLYVPFICMAFIVILFRIMFIPNTLVNLIYPPILLLFTLWQYRVIRKKRKDTLKPHISDVTYSAVSLGAMVIACAVAWLGYVLLAVEVMIWWMFQLAAIQTIICCYDLLEWYETSHIFASVTSEIKQKFAEGHRDTDEDGNPRPLPVIDTDVLKRRIKNGEFITKTWAFDCVNRAIVPIMAVASVLLSIYWAADVFEMTTICKDIFFYDFINQENVIQISLYKICLVVSCWFVFRYVNYAARSFYRYYKQRTLKDGLQSFNLTLANNVIAIVVWGTYFLYALVLLQVPKSGISVVTAGLATGMGFAMKDLLENFFYGISLMTGRVRVGDYIECDGIKGKVESITYQSTQVDTLDGSNIAFLNSQLFNKNFKNLTRNHSYELLKVPVGVAYGVNVDAVRKMLIASITTLKDRVEEERSEKHARENFSGEALLPLIDEKRGISVVFSDFGYNSVDLLVCVWVLVQEKVAFTGRVREVIYNTLNENNVEIPFPQRDVRILQMAAPDEK